MNNHKQVPVPVEIIYNLKQKVSFNKSIQNKVVLINKLPKSELINYTFNADIGLSIDKNTNLNYLYSLPNKIFDYIQAEIPTTKARSLFQDKYGNGGRGLIFSYGAANTYSSVNYKSSFKGDWS